MIDIFVGQTKLKTMKWSNIYCHYIGNGIGWFRIFGAGLHWKDTYNGTHKRDAQQAKAKKNTNIYDRH